MVSRTYRGRKRGGGRKRATSVNPVMFCVLSLFSCLFAFFCVFFCVFLCVFFQIITFTFQLNSYHSRSYPQRSSGQAVVTGVVPSPPRYVPSICIAHRVQHSHCSSTFIECCQLTLSRFPLRSIFMQDKSPYEYVHSVRIELTPEIDFSGHEDNLPSHRRSGVAARVSVLASPGRRIECSWVSGAGGTSFSFGITPKRGAAITDDRLLLVSIVLA